MALTPDQQNILYAIASTQIDPIAAQITIASSKESEVINKINNYVTTGAQRFWDNRVAALQQEIAQRTALLKTALTMQGSIKNFTETVVKSPLKESANV